MIKSARPFYIAALLLLGACNSSRERVAPAADVPSMSGAKSTTPAGTVTVGPNQTRPATREEQALLRQQALAQERAGVKLTRLFTGEHCVVYTFEFKGDVVMFAEGYRDSGGYYPAMACSVSR